MRILFGFLFALSILAGLWPLYDHLIHPRLLPDTPGLYRKSADPTLEWEHTPNWTGIIIGARAHINSLGFRGPEVAPSPAPGVTRLALIGDSVAFGQGVTDEGTLAVALERVLAERTGRRFEVVNGGVRGYASRQYPGTLRRMLPLGPRLLVLEVTVINDPEKEKWVPSSPRLAELKKSWVRRLPWGQLLLAPAFQEEIRRLFVPHVRSLYDPQGPTWQPFLENLAAVQRMTREAGIPLIVVTFPALEAPGLFDDQTRQLQQALSDLGISWIDPEPELRRHPFPTLVAYSHDFHPSANANRIIAALLAEPILSTLDRK